MEKIFISAEDLLADSFELGLRIFESDFRPTFIIGVWRGGTPVGIAIRTSSYGAGTTPSKDVKVFGLRHVVDIVEAEDRLLIIDDVFDSGRSIEAIIKELRVLSRRNAPEDIRVATVYYKPNKNKTDRVPDFYIHEADDWLVFPHELAGCSINELKQNKALPERLFSGEFKTDLDHD